MDRLFFYKRPETTKEKLIAEIEHKKGKENFRKIIEMKSEKTELKPCPFCGGKAVVMGSNDDPFFMVVCLKCNLKVKWYHDLKDEAIIHWNTRNYSEKPNSSKPVAIVANPNELKPLLTRSDIEKMIEPVENLRLFKDYENQTALIKSGCFSLDEVKELFKNWLVSLICSALRIEE